MNQRSSYAPNDNEVGLQTVEAGIRVDGDEAMVDPVEVVAHTRTHEAGDEQAQVADSRSQDFQNENIPMDADDMPVNTEDILMDADDIHVDTDEIYMSDRDDTYAADSETSSSCSTMTPAKFSAKTELTDLLQPSVHDQPSSALPLNETNSTASRKRSRTIPDNASTFSSSDLPPPASDAQSPSPSRKRQCPNPRPKEVSLPFTTVIHNTQHTPDKNEIVEWPAKSNKWYIVPCPRCERNWKANSLGAAHKHLQGLAHGKLKGTYDEVIQELGIKVLGCTRERARENNDAYEELLQAGYEPSNPSRKRTGKSVGGAAIGAIRGAGGDEGPTYDEGDNWIPRPGGGDEDVDDHNREVRKLGSLHKDLAKLHQSPPEEIIWDPVIGEVYQYPWEDRALGDEAPVQWLYVTRLPLNYEDIAASGYLLGSEMWELPNRPSCCTQVMDGQGRATFAWQEGFEKGGDRVRQRQVPLFFFRDGDAIPPANVDFHIDDDATYWGEVVYLRPEHYHHPPNDDTKLLERCRPMVEAFKERLRARGIGKVVVDEDHSQQPADPPSQAASWKAINTEANPVSGSSHLQHLGSC